MKLCPACKKELPLSDFWKNVRCCKVCAKAYQRGRHRDSAKAKILTAISTLGGKCTCCGETTLEFLNFDHIEGRGEQKGFNNYRVAVSVMRGNTYNIRLLCMNCNWSYGLRGYCPHRAFARFGKLANPGGYVGKLKRSTFGNLSNLL